MDRPLHAAQRSPEFFCRLYSDMAGPETAKQYQTPIFLVASASAEIIADVALCPWEAVKVRHVQAVPCT
jgi:solute carrier family 25 (mitochondrial phosphate transporter), member 3